MYKTYTTDYANVYFGASATDVQRLKVDYSPRTTNWNGYDRLFVKGESATTSDLDVWAMLAVVPANNVFYEDNFITTSSETGRAGITYTGAWDKDGTDASNASEFAGDVQGWVDSLADDNTYSNGSAQKTSTNGAKASFTFSGTGVDIYSRTDGGTGMILVSLKGKTKNQAGKSVSKLMVIDNKAASGTYYQIPTCTFTGLEYDEYTVTITANATSDGRLNYYLDGIRVYNPIKPLEVEDNVKDAYGAENLGAVFTEVRSLLVNAGALEGSAVFIDEHTTDATTDPPTTETGVAGDFATYSKEGPKSEVYLSKNEAVVLSLETGNTYYVGLKEIKGVGTTATLNNETKTVSHTSDLYYKVTPVNGKVTITNTGDGILSITKLRTTGASGTSGAKMAPTRELVAAFRSLAALPVVEYTDEVLTEEEAEEPVVEEPVEEVEAEDEEPAVEDLGAEDIVIENPEPEAPAVEPAPAPAKTNNVLSRILSSFLGLFRR